MDMDNSMDGAFLRDARARGGHHVTEGIHPEPLRELCCGFCDRELVDREHVLVWIPSTGRSMAKLVCDVCQVNLRAVTEMFLAREKDEAA
jgi:hypothetical protein